MSQYETITNHVEIAAGRQVWQYKAKENWDNILEAHVSRLQILEDLLAQLRDERGLSGSVGVQLDLLGADYNLTRAQGESDADFRVRIGTGISLLKDSGQTPVLIVSLNRLVAPRATSLKQVFPLKILMWIFVDDFSEISADELARINDSMQQVKAAGVGLEISLQLNDVGFQFSDSLLPGAAGRGFATTIGGTDGGAFSKLIP